VEFDIVDFYETYVEKLQVWLNFDKNMEHFTWRSKFFVSFRATNRP